MPSAVVDLPKFAAALAKLVPALAVPAATFALRREAERIMAASKQQAPSDLAALRNSGYVAEPRVEGARVTVEMGYGGAASGYAVYVHEGTGPAVGRPAFFPPTSDPTTGKLTGLGLWAARHGFVLKTKSGKPRRGAVKEDIVDRSALFLLARAIGRRGLRPLKFLEGPLNEARAGMDARMAADARKRFENG